MNKARQVEEAALNAWPALHQLIYDGWILRFSRGYTKRANSINPVYPSEIDIETKVAACEATYERMGLPAIFRITSIAETKGLDAYLDARGYRQIDRTKVLLCSLDHGRFQVDRRLELRKDSLETWLQIFSEMHQSSADQRSRHGQLLQAIPFQCLFATLIRQGQPVASGLGVLEEPYVGLFDLVTARKERRKGYGTNLLMGILNWAQDLRAHQAYLQVMESNQPALRLYAKEGFKDLYHYWYRVPE